MKNSALLALCFTSIFETKSELNLSTIRDRINNATIQEKMSIQYSHFIADLYTKVFLEIQKQNPKISLSSVYLDFERIINEIIIQPKYENFFNHREALITTAMLWLVFGTSVTDKNSIQECYKKLSEEEKESMISFINYLGLNEKQTCFYQKRQLECIELIEEMFFKFIAHYPEIAKELPELK